MTQEHHSRNPVRLKELAEKVGGKISGDPQLLIHGISGVKEAGSRDITFVSNPRYQSALKTTLAAAVIVSKPLDRSDLSWLVVKNPYLAFAQILGFFYPKPQPTPGISSKASIHERAKLGTDLCISPFVTIEEGAVVGDRVTLYPGVYIGKGSGVGDDSILYPNVSVRENVTIGRRVILHSGAVIGSDGFGFAPDAGRYHKIPQVGNVTLGDDVEIGANVTVDRAVLGKTEIKRGTKIDNQVQIGHNVLIGEDCILVAQVGISGSATLGNRVTLAGQVGVAGHLSIGDNVTVAGKSGVTKDIPSNSVVAGFPAIQHRQWLEDQAGIKRLSELRRQVRSLEGKILLLEKKIDRGPIKKS